MAKNMNNSLTKSDSCYSLYNVLCFVPYATIYPIWLSSSKNDTPEWFQYAVFASLAGSYGLKTLGKFKK